MQLNDNTLGVTRYLLSCTSPRSTRSSKPACRRGVVQRQKHPQWAKKDWQPRGGSRLFPPFPLNQYSTIFSRADTTSPHHLVFFHRDISCLHSAHHARRLPCSKRAWCVRAPTATPIEECDFAVEPGRSLTSCPGGLFVGECREIGKQVPTFLFTLI